MTVTVTETCRKLYVIEYIFVFWSERHFIYHEDGHMSCRNMWVTIIQRKYINKIKSHWLVFNKFCVT